MTVSNLNASVRGVAPDPVEKRISINPTATREFFLPNRLKGTDYKLSDPYRQHGMTFAAVRAIAQGIAQVPFMLHVGASEEDEDVLRDGPWVELFDRPNPLCTTRATFWETTIGQLMEPCGMSVWVKEGHGEADLGAQEIPAELWPFSGRFFKPLIDKQTKLPVGYAFQTPDMARPHVYLPHELVIHKLTDPNNAVGGLGPLAPGDLAIRQDYLAARYNEAFFIHDATPGGVFTVEGRLNPQQRDQIRESWEERHSGISKRRRLAVLEGGMKYQETGSTHRDMEFEKGRAFSWKELLAVVGTPEYEVGLTQNINMATAQMISKDFVSKKQVPLMRTLEDGMWSQLFKPVEGGERALLFSEARMVRRRRQAARMNFPGARTQLATRRAQRGYAEVRTLKRDETSGAYDYTPQRFPGAGMSIWGEFDLTTIEALREDFTEKIEQAAKAQAMGVPFNQINERLDLGFDPLEGDAGETSFISSSLTPIDLKLNPPAPVIAAPGMPGEKSGATPPPKPDESPASPKPASAEKKPEPKKADERLAQLRERVNTFFARRPHAREQRWMRMIRSTKPIEEKFRSKYKRWLMELREDMLKKLSGAARAPEDKKQLSKEQIAQILFNAEQAKKRLASLAHGVYVEASKAGVESAMSDLGGNFAFDVVDPRVVDAIEKRELVLTKSTETLRQRVKRDLEKGVEAGETIHQLQDRLRADFNSFSGVRSLMVARTEVAAATNTARNLAFQEEGVEETEWITARDEAVRDSHAEIDGDRARVGTPFENGLLYPGDPAGDAGEVINCRCIAIPVVGRAP